MIEPNNQDNCARPTSGRAFLCNSKKPTRCTPFWQAIPLPPLKAHLVFWPFMILGLLLDLWTKKAAFALLSKRQTPAIPIIEGVLHFVEEQNPGAAFGIAAGQRHLLISVSVIAMVLILGIFLYSANERRLIHVALGLFAAGVCGNLYDRLFNDGMVRDFIDIVYWPGRHWPALNIADSLLCIGVGLMIVSVLLTDKSAQEHARQHK